MQYDCYLLTETTFHASYLVTLWKNNFDNKKQFTKILVREKRKASKVLDNRELFHTTYQHKKKLSEKEKALLQTLYSTISKTEEAMIDLYGISPYSCTSLKQTHFLGENLNSVYVKNWLQRICRESKNPPFFFIFLDQILAPWWITSTKGKIINAHSAVLPYARGMYAIENIALTKNKELFQKCAGASVHYIDTGVDTGPIIQTQQLENVYIYDSLWDVKAASFMLAFRLLVDTANRLTQYPYILPSIQPTSSLVVGKNFKSKDFSEEVAKKANRAFMDMKQ